VAGDASKEEMMERINEVAKKENELADRLAYFQIQS
jgi:hypothetical protein